MSVGEFRSGAFIGVADEHATGKAPRQEGEFEQTRANTVITHDRMIDVAQNVVG